jgi:hypothetical protein
MVKHSPEVLPVIKSFLHLSWFIATVAPRANVALSITHNSLASGSILSPSYSTQQCKVRLNELNNQIAVAQQEVLAIWSSRITEYWSIIIGDSS